jgi:ribonuclease HI
MAVPSNFEICDAEIYAILRYLRHVVEQSDAEAGMPVSARRVLVLSDCQPAMDQIEAAWRAGGRVASVPGGCADMLEEICAHRARLDRVVIMYTPGHRGVSPNEYADAAAKAHAAGEVSPHVALEVAARVVSRPCVYEGTSDGDGLCQRPMFQEVRGRMTAWVRKTLGASAARGLVLGQDGDVWRDVLRMTAVADDTGKGGW